MDFNWFVSHHQAYPEKIDDLREWVRDIWNTWFDEVTELPFVRCLFTQVYFVQGLHAHTPCAYIRHVP